jgi:hypothetical protein
MEVLDAEKGASKIQMVAINFEQIINTIES